MVDELPHLRGLFWSADFDYLLLCLLIFVVLSRHGSPRQHVIKHMMLFAQNLQ